jgi:hypothetical protein
MWARDGADSAGDLGTRSTAEHWRDGQITRLALTVRQENTLISGARCFAHELFNATKFRARVERDDAPMPIRLKAAGSPDDSDRIDLLRRIF